MKISKEKKSENKRAVLQAAMQLIGSRGFAKTSMSAVAKKCKMSNAAIYNYFSSKEELVLGIYEFTINEALTRYSRTDGLGELRPEEKLFLLSREVLRELEPAEDFLQETFSSVFLQSVGLGASVQRIRIAVSREVLGILDQAEASGAFAENPLRQLSASLFWDFLVGVIYYWQKDTSDSKTRSMELLERSTALIAEVLRVPIFRHSLDIAQFLIREHLFTRLLGVQNGL